MAERKTGASRSGAKPAKKRSMPSKTTKASTAKESTTKPASEATTRKASGASASKGRAKPAPNLNERMEGLQGWMAEIERKQDRMTKIGGGAAIVAVLASAAALALGVIGMQSNAS